MLLGLRSLQNTLHQEAEADRKAREAATKEQAPQPTARSFLDFIKGVQSENRESHGKQDKYQRRTLYATWAGVFVVLAYTTFTLLLLREARTANDLTLSNFREQHRAWVFIDDIVTMTDDNGKPKMVSPRELTVGHLLFVRVHFKNTGNSPALSFSTRTFVEIGWSRTPVQDTFPFEEVAPGHRTLPTGKDTYEDPIVSPHINKIQIESLKNNQRVHGRVAYRDVFGVEHWTRFCSVLFSGGGWAICEHGNEADENPELPPRRHWWQ